jgi:hypothetical protein
MGTPRPTPIPTPFETLEPDVPVLLEELVVRLDDDLFPEGAGAGLGGGGA